MTDEAAHQQKNDADRGSPSEIDHAQLDEFSADHISQKMPGKEPGNGDQDVHKDRKHIPARDQMKNTAVKSRDNENEKNCLYSHIGSRFLFSIEIIIANPEHTEKPCLFRVLL